jgi:uncharacterized NAD(P)/FAD-binding protein YdhS
MSAVDHDVVERVVAIIGCGFSGAMVAIHLAQHAGASPVRILLIEKEARFGRGLAYSTRCDRHLLNVPAGMMSALPDQPTHFLDWLQSREADSHAAMFAPRKRYGEYLEELLMTTARDGAVPIEFVRDEAVEVRMGPGRDSRVSVQTGSGRLIIADRVVLAMGNQPPSDPPGLRRSTSSRRYVGNPWSSSPLEGLVGDEPIALIGSGLTAVDVVVEANERGHRGVIHAISRHGLLPNRHLSATPRPHFQLMEAKRRTTARTLLHSVRSETARCEAEGGDWRQVIDSIRPVAQSLWRSLECGERQRFIRHLASHWDVHRHRVAPEIDDLLQAKLREGRLIVFAGRALSWKEQADRTVLTLQRRGRAETETLVVGRVINCSGPARDIRVSPNTLLRSVISNGIGRPGPLALGLDVADSGALIGPDGRIHDRIFAIGPLLKEHLWETTAVRELRVQAMELAPRLLVEDRTTDRPGDLQRELARPSRG